MRSLLTDRHRARVVFSTVHFRPRNETFAEFLIQLVIWTFDEEWWKHQNSASTKERHLLRQWWDSWGAFNVPPTPEIPLGDKPWLADMNRVFDQMEHGAGETLWSVIVATNFGLQFGADDLPTPPVEAGMLWSTRPRVSVPESLRKAIIHQVLSYGRIPTEI